MYTVKINEKVQRSYYNVTLASSDDSHFLNIYVSEEQNGIWVSISKSEDGFYFKSPCAEASELQISSSNNIEETYNYVKNHFLNKGYKFSAP